MTPALLQDTITFNRFLYQVGIGGSVLVLIAALAVLWWFSRHGGYDELSAFFCAVGLVAVLLGACWFCGSVERLYKLEYCPDLYEHELTKNLRVEAEP